MTSSEYRATSALHQVDPWSSGTLYAGEPRGPPNVDAPDHTCFQGPGAWTPIQGRAQFIHRVFFGDPLPEIQA